MTLIKIVDRWDSTRVLHECDAETFRDAVLKAVASRADLSGADLSGADLSRANLSRADFSGADFSGANLSRADFSGANLSGADLSGADLSRAYLSGADLSRADLSGADLSGADLSRADLSGAYLSGADLSGADLSRAYLSGADLSGADLDTIRTDVFEVLDGAPLDVVGLLEALRTGKVDGSVYTGTCACLVGTLENSAVARGCQVALPHNGSRPAERWFLALAPGHTPENHPVAKITEGWVVEWLAAWATKSPELHAKATSDAAQREIARLEARIAELSATVSA